jgi:hypothetical protein
MELAVSRSQLRVKIRNGPCFRPAVVGRDIIPVGYLLELFDKPLLLNLFAFKDNPRFQKTASCSHGFEKASPSAGLRAFQEGLPLGIAVADN